MVRLKSIEGSTDSIWLMKQKIICLPTPRERSSSDCETLNFVYSIYLNITQAMFEHHEVQIYGMLYKLYTGMTNGNRSKALLD